MGALSFASFSPRPLSASAHIEQGLDNDEGRPVASFAQFELIEITREIIR